MKIKLIFGLCMLFNFAWAQDNFLRSQTEEKRIPPVANICSMAPKYKSIRVYKDSHWLDNGGFPDREMTAECRSKGGDYITSVILIDKPSPTTWYGSMRTDTRRTFSYECYRNEEIPVNICVRLKDCLLNNTIENTQADIFYYYHFFKCDL